MNKHTHLYWIQGKEGENAKPGTICPYGMIDIGPRCAWLAAHYDRYGRRAWDKARQYIKEERLLYEKESYQN